MAKELEVKVLGINKEEIEEKLKEIGAKLIKKEYQINTIFDTDNRSVKKDLNGYLRIRESRDLINENVKYIFTLKKNIAKDEVRENVEIETVIEDDKALIEILHNLDLTIKHRGSKDRTSYVYDNMRFDIDTWDSDTYPETYLEIEVDNREDLNKAIKLLDLNRENVTSKSLGQLRMELGLKDL